MAAVSTEILLFILLHGLAETEEAQVSIYPSPTMAADDTLRIQADPSVILEGVTKTLSIICTLGDVSSIGNPVNIALFKETSPTTREKIVSVTMFHPDSPHLTTENNNTVTSGHIGAQRGSYVSIYKDSPSMDDAGNYQCEASVLDKNDNELCFINNVTVVSKTPFIMELLDLLRQEVTEMGVHQKEMEAENIRNRELLVDMEQDHILLMSENEKLKDNQTQLMKEIDKLEDFKKEIMSQLDNLSEELRQGFKENQTGQLAEGDKMMLQLKILKNDATELTSTVEQLNSDLERSEKFFSSEFVNGTQYHVSKALYSNMAAAKASCESIGADLADLKSVEELKQAMNFSLSLGFGTQHYKDIYANVVVGFSDESSEGLWVSITTGENATLDLVSDLKGNDNAHNCAYFYLKDISKPRLVAGFCSNDEYGFLKRFLCETKMFE